MNEDLSFSRRELLFMLPCFIIALLMARFISPGSQLGISIGFMAFDILIWLKLFIVHPDICLESPEQLTKAQNNLYAYYRGLRFIRDGLLSFAAAQLSVAILRWLAILPF